MATGLNIHIDKENATPSFFPNKGGKGILTQATPRKALNDVNKDTSRPILVKTSWKEETFTKPSAESFKPLREKINANQSTNVAPPKKMSQQKNIQKKEGKTSQHPSSTKASKQKKKVQMPDPPPAEEDGYDSDTIWPRSERLSTHLQSLLAWRPSCFAGNDYESDLDNSLSEGEIPDQIIIEKPQGYNPFMDMPEFDMESILASLPDPEEP